LPWVRGGENGYFVLRFLTEDLGKRLDRNPGPDDNAIEAHAKSVVAARSRWAPEAT
jgi:hypothetical protein